MTANRNLVLSAAALVALAAGSSALAQTQPPGAYAPGAPAESEAPQSVPPRTSVAPEDSGAIRSRTLPAPDSPGRIATDRTDLGRDCVAIDSRVQRTICLNRDLAALDQDARRLGGADHGAWAAQLESCAAAAPTVYDGPIYRCVKARYEARLVQLSRRAGGTMTGHFRLVGSGAIAGNMTVVEFPQERVSVSFDKITADGARACTVRMDGQASAGVIEGTPPGLPGCRVAIALGRGTARVQSNGCEALCEMGERVDGTYTSLQAIAPGAAPSRKAVLRPAALKGAAPKAPKAAVFKNTAPKAAPQPAAPKSAAPRY